MLKYAGPGHSCGHEIQDLPKETERKGKTAGGKAKPNDCSRREPKLTYRHPGPPPKTHMLAHNPLKLQLHMMSSWWSRLLADLLEDPGSAPSTHVMAHNPVTLGPEDLMPFFGLHRHQAHTWHIYIHASKTLIHVKHKQVFCLFFKKNRGMEGQDGVDRKWQLSLLYLDCVLKD